MAELAVTLDITHPELRRIGVAIEFDREAWPADASGPDAGIQARTLFLPTWTPGSYLIREFARHLGPVLAADVQTHAPLECTKCGKNRYRVLVPETTRRVRVCYHVYAHELTVRTADVTPEHAFWNHANVLLWPVGRPRLQAELTVLYPDAWDLECPLPRAAPAARGRGEARFRAADLDAIMDAPVLAGTLQRLEWQSRGRTHRAVLEGLAGVTAPESLVADAGRIVERTADVFGEVPYREYSFLCLFTDAGRGGLEHRDGSVLLSSRTALRPGKAYQEFLGLLAHELFHAWNVKRMRPAELWDYDYEAENFTPMLWLAEGFTAYYDDLLCRRAGVLSADDYLAILARNLTSMLSGSGRRKQSLASASHDAWIRFYRPDENTRNSTQNYYVNGSIAALCLDLTIRRASKGARSLDDALRHLWRSTWLGGRGYRREDVAECLTAAAGCDLSGLLSRLVDGPLEPDLEPLLAAFGIALQTKDRDKPYLGIGFEDGTTAVAFVNEDGPAFAAGIAPGDEVLALNGLRTTAERWTEVFQCAAAVGRPLAVLTSSRGCIRERSVTPVGNPVGTLALEQIAGAAPEQQTLRAGWLGGDPQSSSGRAADPH